MLLPVLIEADDQNEIIVVARYTHDPDEQIADLGIAVRDNWQNLGIGKLLLSKIIIIGKEHSISRFSTPKSQSHIPVDRPGRFSNY